MHCVILLTKKNGFTRLLQAKCCLNTTFSRSRSASALCVYSTCVYCHSVPPNRPQMTENRTGPLMKGRKKSSQAFLSFPPAAVLLVSTGRRRQGQIYLRVSIISNRSAAEYMTETITKASAINQRGNGTEFIFCSAVMLEEGAG